MFGHLSSSDLTHRLRALNPDFNVKSLRLSVMKSGYIMGNTKLYAYASGVKRDVKGAHYSIVAEDSKLIRYLIKSNPDLQSMMLKLYKRGSGFKPATVAEMSSLMTFVHSEVDEYTSKFVYRKLRFISESNGIEEDDIKNELLYASTYALYKQYPRFQSRLHAVNIAKQSIHNRGINMIHEATSESRRRLISSKDGTFSSLVLPIHTLGIGQFLDNSNYLNQCNYLVTSIDGSSANGSTITSIQDAFELKNSVASIYRDIGNPTLRRLMKLWSGEYDEEFSKYLGTSNDDFADTVEPREYMISCAKFLKVPGKTAKSFLDRLRTELKDYK